MARLTKSHIDKITPPPTGYELHWDEQDKGFGLRITKDGKRTYIVQGRIYGKEARISIGPHGVFTPDQAREVAREHLRSMRQGIDPRAVAKERAAEAVTLRDVADAYKRDRPLKESSKGEIERHVTTTFDAWLKKPLTSITREAVTKRFNEIRNHGLRGDGPAPAQANQGFSVLRALFNYAIREYRRPDGAAIIKGSDFVFTSWGKAGHIRDPRDTMKNLSEVAGLHLSPHDLRRTFTTIGIASCGIDFFKVELLTNHVPKTVTGRHYLETSHLQYLLPEVQRIADWIVAQAETVSDGTAQNELPLAA